MPSPLLTKTVCIPVARALIAIWARSPFSDLFSSQIHMPLPLNASGSCPSVTALGLGLGAVAIGLTWTCRGFERRPARSRTVTDTAPSFVPAGIRAIHPEALCCSVVASAPVGQRNDTRMPL